MSQVGPLPPSLIFQLSLPDVSARAALGVVPWQDSGGFSSCLRRLQKKLQLPPLHFILGVKGNQLGSRGDQLQGKDSAQGNGREPALGTLNVSVFTRP